MNELLYALGCEVVNCLL